MELGGIKKFRPWTRAGPHIGGVLCQGGEGGDEGGEFGEEGRGGGIGGGSRGVCGGGGG